MTENQIVQGCIAGSVHCQKQLYIQFAPKMMAICMRYSASKEEAEDMLQEAFIRVFSKIDTFKQDGPLGAWVRRVVVNTAAEVYRKEKKHNLNRDVEDHLYGMYSRDYIIEQLAANDLMAVIRQLPEGYRVVFNLYAIEGYSHKEIGDMLSISESTSKSQYSRARAAIRKAIEHEYSRSGKAV